MNHTTLLLGTVIIFLLAGLGYATVPGYLEKTAGETDTASLETEVSPETGNDVALEEENESEDEYEDDATENEAGEYESEDGYEDEPEDKEDEQPIATTPTPAPETATTPEPTPTPTPQAGYTLSQVAAHADASSCWTAVDGVVYDLTSFISKHPGGASKIKRICGKDGTAAFSNEHGGDRKPENTLESYQIGPLI